MIASLDQEPADPDAEKLWIAETQRRAEELATGKVKDVPMEKVLKKARFAPVTNGSSSTRWLNVNLSKRPNFTKRARMVWAQTSFARRNIR